MDNSHDVLFCKRVPRIHQSAAVNWKPHLLAKTKSRHCDNNSVSRPVRRSESVPDDFVVAITLPRKSGPDAQCSLISHTRGVICVCRLRKISSPIPVPFRWWRSPSGTYYCRYLSLRVWLWIHSPFPWQPSNHSFQYYSATTLLPFAYSTVIGNSSFDGYLWGLEEILDPGITGHQPNHLLEEGHTHWPVIGCGLK